MENCILYAPGKGYDIVVLNEFRAELEKLGKSIHLIPIDYDSGSFDPISLISRLPPMCKWWIGISLGASLLYILAACSTDKIRPNRIALINPFADRSRLSHEIGFNLLAQWDLTPIRYCLNVTYLDIVLSLRDKSIPTNHGLELLVKCQSEMKRLILIDSDHKISDPLTQRKLAMILADKKELDIDNGERCDIFTWQRNI